MLQQQTGLIEELHQEIIEQLGSRINDLYLERVVIGIFFTGVILTNGCSGMSATPIKSIPEAVCCPSSAKAFLSPGKLKGKSVNQVLMDLSSIHPLRKTLAIATLNALAETLWAEDGSPNNATIGLGDAFSHMIIPTDANVVLIGAFPPFMRELRKRNQQFKVLEMDPSTLKPEELPFYVPAEQASIIIPQADVLITTATTLINGSLQALLALANDTADIAIIGPSAPLVTKTFAQYKVSIIGGTRVTDGEALLDILAEGGSGYHFFEKVVQRIVLSLN